MYTFVHVPACADAQAIMEGAMDLLVETDDGLWILDFKTDQVACGDEAQAARKYIPQIETYAHAVRQATGCSKVEASLVFLRTGTEVKVPMDRV